MNRICRNRLYSVSAHLLGFSLFALILNPMQLPAQQYANSPEVQSDGKVTFRYFAPSAKKVKLTGNVPLIKGDMVKGEKGIWSITVGPLKANTYPYRFLVDGAVALDPVNRNTKAWLWMENLVVVPANSEDAEATPIHYVQDVPHGSVTINWYRSPRMKKTRRVFVYTPPGYQKSTDKYPVLYLLHGFGDDASAWSRVGQANHILDNMIAAKRAKPAILVMPFGHDDFPETPNIEKYSFLDNISAVEKELLEGVIPFVEANYRCKTSSADRGVAGLSMGGGQALQFGINNLDKFKWIAGFSSAIDKQRVDQTAMMKLGDLKEHKPWLWLGCGKSDFLLQDTVKLDKWLTENEIKHQTRFTTGAHNWRCWRSYLEEILGEVFKE